MDGEMIFFIFFFIFSLNLNRFFWVEEFREYLSFE